MWIAHSITKAEPIPMIAPAWGNEWDEYIAATVRGFVSAMSGIEEQIKTVCFRECLWPQIGFSFSIGTRWTSVEVFFWIKELQQPLNLCLDLLNCLTIHHSLQTKEELENDGTWAEFVEYRAKVSAKYLAADLARDGLPADMKRRIVLIAQFAKIFYGSCSVLEWREM